MPNQKYISIDHQGDVMAQDPEVLATAIARNVRRLRRRRDLTLDVLAEQAGVSKGTVIGLEQGRANPSITTLCRLADALGVGVSTLIESDVPQVRIKRRADTPALWSTESGTQALFLMGTDPPDSVELWDWRLMGGDSFHGEAHPTGTVEILTVLDGLLTVVIGAREHTVETGDTILFDAVVDHRYGNPSDQPNRFIMTVLQSADSGMVPPGHIAPAGHPDADA
jgi:transcriptional regulator with XRE-family HTH domain